MTLTETLSRYVDSPGLLGGGGATAAKNRIAHREALVQELREDFAAAQRMLAFWGASVAATFVFLMVAASLRLVEPYIALPAGCGGFFLVLRRLESVWRELRLVSLALQMALMCEDEAMLREVMTTLNAALLAETQKRFERRPQLAAPRAP